MVAALVSIANIYVYADEIADYDSARLYCDRNALTGPEGIWEFPEDETSVFIRRDATQRGMYNIYLLESADCRFEPGEKVGHLVASADKEKYRLFLRIEKSDDLLASTRNCVATMDKDASRLLITPAKLKIAFRTMWFLPKFWRSLKVSIDNPQRNIPVGLVKIYPDNEEELPIYF